MIYLAGLCVRLITSAMVVDLLLRFRKIIIKKLLLGLI